MKHDPELGGLDFGHEFHGREHHFLLTREALEYLAGRSVLDEIGSINTYNANLAQIHSVAERLSRAADPLERVVLERAAFEHARADGR
jgi:hypothetical protein